MPDKIKILLAEDETKTAQAIKKGLEESGVDTTVCFDGMTARQLLSQNNYDVIVLDIILPHFTGLEVCKFVRTQNINTPIILLTALGAVDNKVTGFDAGADDYLVKPFEFRELLARIKSLARRSKSEWNNFSSLQLGDLILDLNTKTASRSGRKIVLTAREFALLEYLIRNKNKVVSKSNISEEVWSHYSTSSNIVEVYMNYLRKKVDKDHHQKLIHTVIGMGYILKDTE